MDDFEKDIARMVYLLETNGFPPPYRMTVPPSITEEQAAEIMAASHGKIMLIASDPSIPSDSLYLDSDEERA